MVVDLADCGDGIATKSVICNVTDAVAGQSIAFTQKFVHGFGPVIDRLPAHRERIDDIAEGATKDRYKT